MQHTIRLFSEIVLATFVIAIVAAATITTIGLSPVALEQPVTANNVLGIDNSGGSSGLSLQDPNDSASLEKISDKLYQYTDQLQNILANKVFEKDFLTFTNTKGTNQKYSLIAQVNSAASDIVEISLVDAVGNSTLLKTPRILEIPANSLQSYRIRVQSIENVNFGLTFSIMVAEVE